MLKKILFNLIIIFTIIGQSVLSQATISKGTMIRMRFDQGSANLSDQVGAWYNAGADSLKSYYEYIKFGEVEYFVTITQKNMAGGASAECPVYFKIENARNSSEEHIFYERDLNDKVYPYSIEEDYEFLKAKNGMWFLGGSYGHKFVSNMGEFYDKYLSHNLDTTFILQHIVGQIDDKYAAVFYNNNSKKYSCFLFDLDNSPFIDTTYGEEIFLSDSVSPKHITYIQDSIYLMKTTDAGIYSDTFKLYKSYGNHFQFIKSIRLYWGQCRYRNNKLIFFNHAYNTYLRYNKADTSFLYESYSHNGTIYDKEFKYEAGLKGDSIIIYNAETTEKLYSIYTKNINNSKHGMLVDSPYVFAPHLIQTIDIPDVGDIGPLLNYELSAYPNPFNPQTTIAFTIPNAGKVELAVYDVLGRKVTELLNEYRDKGSYEVKFNGANLASGIYFYTIKTGNFVKTEKLMLLK